MSPDALTNIDTLIERLKDCDPYDWPNATDDLCQEAADALAKTQERIIKLQDDNATIADNALVLEANYKDAQAEIARLRDALAEAVAMLEIYYVPNSDGSTPTITKAKALL